ncbi:MAG: hypothetical protein JWN31_2127, partial [Frankiales bacterium]|nr:hypothetical protein [Frankiales bacterium]
MSLTARTGRLQQTAVIGCLVLLTAACGLKTSAVDNLKAAGSAQGPVGTSTGGLGGTGAGTGGLPGTTGTGTTGTGGVPLPGTTGGTSTGGSTSAGTATGTGGSTSGTSSTGTTGATHGPCGVPTGGDTTGITKSTINIGLHAPLTGTGTPFPNSSFQKGAQVFFDQPQNKVCGRKVRVDFEDDTYTPTGANKVCTAFAKTSFLAIGGAGTDQIQACATNTEMVRKGVPYLSAGVTDNGLTTLKDYFALSLTYKQQGGIVVRNAIAQGFGRPKPSAGGAHKQWEIVTGNTKNFDSATTGIQTALGQAGITYHTTRFDQNSGN